MRRSELVAAGLWLLVTMRKWAGLTVTDINSDIDYIESELRQTTAPGSKVKPWPPTSGHWGNAWARLESLRTQPTPPPPPPPPPPSSQILGFYDAPASGSGGIDWDAIKTDVPKAQFVMASQDTSVINHIGTDVQWVQYLEQFFLQYGVPCWKTGLVEGFMVYDEPGSDSTSLATIKSRVATVKANCTGTNKQGKAVRTSVTQYDANTLAALAAAKLVDVLMIDRYPSRDGWDYTQWNACVAACDKAVAAGQISEYWVVLDCFQSLPSYPAPTQAQLQDQIARSQATNAKRLVAYSWGPGAGSPELSQLPGLVAALNTIS